MQVTFDIDSRGWLANLRAFAVSLYVLKHHGKPGANLTVKSSPSGSGFHYIVDNVRVSKRELLKFRRVGGDDERRIRFDVLREAQGYPTQVLFYKKRTIRL